MTRFKETLLNLLRSAYINIVGTRTAPGILTYLPICCGSCAPLARNLPLLAMVKQSSEGSCVQRSGDWRSGGFYG
jgi:hypothetical protein